MSAAHEQHNPRATGPFRPADRLVKKPQFDAVFSAGTPFRFSEITLRALPNHLSHSRLGMLVGRRCGNAVRRNRIKRLLRETFRRNRHTLAIPCDLVIVPRNDWRDLSLAAIQPVFIEALARVQKTFTCSRGGH